MKTEHIKLSHKIILIIIFLVDTVTWAKNPTDTQVEVNLLGQKCSIQGPFDTPTLKNIHSIGPAQIYPDNLSIETPTASKEQIRKTIEKIHSYTALPSTLDLYRKKLENRLEAQMGFFEAFDSFGKTLQTSSFLKLSKHYLLSKDRSEFEALVKKLIHSKKEAPAQKEKLEQVFDFYNEATEQNTEANFHLAIKKMKIQYTCSFEESDDPSEAEK